MIEFGGVLIAICPLYWHHCQQFHWHRYLEFQGLYLPKPKALWPSHHWIQAFRLQQTEGVQGFLVWGSQFLGTYGYEKPMVQSTYGPGHIWSQSHVLWGVRIQI